MPEVVLPPLVVHQVEQLRRRVQVGDELAVCRHTSIARCSRRFLRWARKFGCRFRTTEARKHPLDSKFPREPRASWWQPIAEFIPLAAAAARCLSTSHRL